MPEIIRERKDYMDRRPIPSSGPKSFSFRWKLLALLELNEDGQYVFPFSRRVVNDFIRPLWPRSYSQPPPPEYELCGCAGCETKTWEDHILKEDEDDAVSPHGNLHIDYRCEDTDDDDDDDDVEKENYRGDGQHYLEKSELSVFSTDDDDDDDASEDSLHLRKKFRATSITTFESCSEVDESDRMDDDSDSHESYDWDYE